MGGSTGRFLDPTSSEHLGGILGENNPLSPAGQAKGGEPPAAPDFAGAAEAQAEASRAAVAEQTQANRPNQNGPFGSTQWTQDADGNWTQTTSLSRDLTAASDALQRRLAAEAGEPIMTGDAARDQAIQAAYSQSTSRLDPQWTQRSSALETQLANEGFGRGDQAYATAMENLGRERNDAYSSAMNGAIGQGTQAGAATFAQNLAARMAPYQQLNQLRGIGTAPAFTAAGQSDEENSLAAAMQQYSSALQQYGIDQAGANSKMGGASSLGSAYLMSRSDESLKTEIERLDVDALPGVPWARWKWKDGSGEGVGVIAQDLEKVRPDLVSMHPDGYRMVDYGGLLEATR